MSGVRILLFTLAAFALLCVVGFSLLEESPAPDLPRSAPTARPPTPMPEDSEPPPDAEVGEPPPPARAAAPLETDIEVREPEVHVEPDVEVPPTWSGDVITAPGTRWIEAVEREAHRLLSLCLETDGEQLDGPLEISIELVYEGDARDEPTERRASLSVQDPYLQACATDSLLDLDYPDPGGPAAFTHRARFTWAAP